MSTLDAALVMLLIFFFFVVIKMPMGIALGTSSIIGVILAGLSLNVIGASAFESLYSFSILAIPFFIFAGNIMSEGGISEKLVELAHMIVARFTGGLAMVVVLASAFFAALSGSSTATTIAIGGMMVPEMVERGYDKDYSLAVAAAGGVIGPIIPPSVGFILYGVQTSTSVADMFMGGVGPGLVMLLFELITVYITCKKKGYAGERQHLSGKEKLKVVWSAKWAILVPIIILGGIYSGIFTPTEAGAVACAYSLIVAAFIEKRLTWKSLYQALVDSALMSATCLFLISTATVFGKVMIFGQVPQQVSELILSLSHNPVVIMILINVFLLIVGCIMDATVSILILSPMLLPVALECGFTNVEFGVILVSNLTIGAITPPVGCCLFAASVMGKRPLEKIAYQALPFLACLCATLVVMILFPQVISWLPNLING